MTVTLNFYFLKNRTRENAHFLTTKIFKSWVCLFTWNKIIDQCWYICQVSESILMRIHFFFDLLTFYQRRSKVNDTKTLKVVYQATCLKSSKSQFSKKKKNWNRLCIQLIRTNTLVFIMWKSWFDLWVFSTNGFLT